MAYCPSPNGPLCSAGCYQVGSVFDFVFFCRCTCRVGGCSKHPGSMWTRPDRFYVSPAWRCQQHSPTPKNPQRQHQEQQRQPTALPPSPLAGKRQQGGPHLPNYQENRARFQPKHVFRRPRGKAAFGVVNPDEGTTEDAGQRNLPGGAGGIAGRRLVPGACGCSPGRQLPQRRGFGGGSLHAPVLPGALDVALSTPPCVYWEPFAVFIAWHQSYSPMEAW